MSVKYIQFKDKDNNYLYPVVTVNTIVGSDNQTPVMPVITTDIVQSVRAVTSASSNSIPSELAVANALSGVSITINQGTGITITANNTINANIAVAGTTSTASAGIVKPNGNQFTVDANGFMSINAASTSSAGIVQLVSDIENASGTSLNLPPTVDAVKTYISGQTPSLTCELFS